MSKKKKKKPARPEQRTDYALRVTFTPADAQIVMKALDLYTRLQMGQLQELGMIFWQRDGRSDVRPDARGPARSRTDRRLRRPFADHAAAAA